jgi:hypothetical protein
MRTTVEDNLKGSPVTQVDRGDRVVDDVEQMSNRFVSSIPLGAPDVDGCRNYNPLFVHGTVDLVTHRIHYNLPFCW